MVQTTLPIRGLHTPCAVLLDMNAIGGSYKPHNSSCRKWNLCVFTSLAPQSVSTWSEASRQGRTQH